MAFSLSLQSFLLLSLSSAVLVTFWLMARREREERSSISVDGDAVDKQMIVDNCKRAADDKVMSSSVTTKMKKTGQGSGNKKVNRQFLQEDDPCDQQIVSDYPRSTRPHFDPGDRSPKPSETRSTRHPIHPAHDLQRKTDEKNYTCDGCKMPGFGTRYTCHQCSFEFNLHEKCTFSREDSPATRHYLFGESTFKFFYKLPQICKGGRCGECHRLCEACAKPTKGFVYYCKDNNKDNNKCFHPCCFDLESKFSTEDEYKTEFELCPKETYSKCHLCNQKQVEGSESDNRGWTYVSKCKNLTVHVFCYMNSTVKRKNGDLSFVKKNPKPPSRKKKNGIKIFEIACVFSEILVGVLSGDVVVSPVLGLLQLINILGQVQRKGNSQRRAILN